MAFQVDRRDSENGCALHFSGSLDGNAFAGIRSALSGLPDCRELDLDLSEVDAIDSSGMGALLMIREEIAPTALRLRKVSSIVKWKLELAGVYAVLLTPVEPPGDAV